MSAIPLLKFTPSAMDTESLEAITVQRESLIQGLVDSALDTEGGNRHHLLVGPRGMGKSHVLTLVAERIRAASNDSLILAVLNEDPWAVRSYAKFLAAILGAIDHPKAPAVRSRGNDGEAERLLREAIGDRRLVLVIENLDEIFRRIGPEGQKRLRAFAENWSQLLVLASTPQLFAGINRHASPFYAFFRITHLDELTPENAGELLRRVARLRGDDELAEFLDTETAQRRILAINALAGGHPRIWLLFAGCISIPAIEQLVPLFLEALDDLTPYYQARLAELGDQQQELVLLLCEAGGALSNRQLADRSGLPQNQISAALGKLEDRGYVRSATLPQALSTGDARARYWDLREPLMRLALDVKQAHGRPLILVVEFLKAWYGTRILDEISRIPKTAALSMTYAVAAFRAILADRDLEDLLDGSPEVVVDRTARALALAPQDLFLVTTHAGALETVGRTRDAIEILDRAAQTLTSSTDRDAATVFAALLRLEIDESVDRQALAAAAARLSTTGHDARFQYLAGIAFEHVDDQLRALEAYTVATQLLPDDADFHALRSGVLLVLERLPEAAAALGRACELEPTNGEFHLRHAATLSSLGDTEGAHEAVLRSIGLHDTLNARVLAALAASHLGDEHAAYQHIQRALQLIESWTLDPDSVSEAASALWYLRADRATVHRFLQACTEHEVLPPVAQGLVTLVPDLVMHPNEALAWLEGWKAPHYPELMVPIGMVRAAIEFARTEDRAHLLALPAEQREIVIELLQRREDGVELGDDVA